MTQEMGARGFRRSGGEDPGMGVIAQEVEAVFPELIQPDERGRKRVDYFGLVPPLMAAVAQLRTRVTALEASIGDDRAVSEKHTRPVSKAAPAQLSTTLDPDAVARIYPELVTVDEHGEKTVAYHSLIGPLIEAVKELDARLQALEDATPGGS